MNTFKITKIDTVKNHVSVIYSIDGVEQTMGDAPTGDVAALKAFLADYGARYEASILASRAADEKAKTEVAALVGQEFDCCAVKGEVAP